MLVATRAGNPDTWAENDGRSPNDRFCSAPPTAPAEIESRRDGLNLAQDAVLGGPNDGEIVPKGTAEDVPHEVHRRVSVILTSYNPATYCLIIALYPSDSNFCLISVACVRLANGPT
jgi:hypothetical protein